MATKQTTREALEAEIKLLSDRIAQNTKAIEADRAAGREAEAKLHKLTISELVGVKDAVCVRYLGWEKGLDDAVGTLLKVNRTWAVVDFGSHGRSRFEIKELLPATKRAERFGWNPLLGV